LDEIIEKIPAPQGDINAPLQALIFDSQFDQYRGVVSSVRVVRFRLDSDEWKLESGPSLWLRNPNLPNGMLYVYGGKYDLTNLRKLVMDRFCSDMNPSTKEVEDVLDSINKGISVSVYRNNKLNKVLNGVK
jgi:hypothetical protein